MDKKHKKSTTIEINIKRELLKSKPLENQKVTKKNIKNNKN